MSRGSSRPASAPPEEEGLIPAAVGQADDMRDTPEMGEGNVGRTGDDVACAAESHMSEAGDLEFGAPEGKDGEDASTNTPTCIPSTEMEVDESGAMEDGPPASCEHSYKELPPDEPERGRRARRTPDTQSPSSSSTRADHPFRFKQTSSGSSSDSEATVTQSDTESHHPRDMDPSHAKLSLQSGSPALSRPNPLSFLEPDSPDITPESIRRSIEESTARWRPRTSPSSASSGSSASDVFSQTDPGTSPSSSPAQSARGSPTPRPPAGRPSKSYGTPEMPRGTANHPHIPPNALQPRLGSHHVKPLPRAEKLPLSGYQLVASKLSSSHPLSPPIQPIYRRFETLNHRILLHLQDELAELEEQLHRLDTADTQTRRLRSCFLPASRRTEVLAGGELQWHKTDILGKIGYKLEQYNRVLATFVKTQGFASPCPSEMEEYRSFLEVQKPIAELETRFLDGPDDLIALRGPPPAPDCLSSGAPTPMPRAERPSSPALHESDLKPAAAAPAPSSPALHESDPKPAAAAPAPAPQVSIPSVAAAVAVAVLLPVLSFASVPGLPGRMAVIWLVAAGVLNPLLQAGGLRGEVGGRDALACAGIFGGAMSVVALAFS